MVCLFYQVGIKRIILFSFSKWVVLIKLNLGTSTMTGSKTLFLVKKPGETKGMRMSEWNTELEQMNGMKIDSFILYRSTNCQILPVNRNCNLLLGKRNLIDRFIKEYAGDTQMMII